MSQGEIVEQGRHVDLLHAGGAYTKLHQKGENGSLPSGAL